MNKVVLMGHLVRVPEVKTSRKENAIPIVRFTLAVDRRTKKEGEVN